MNEGKTNREVPDGTNSSDWRIMSAKVAHALWESNRALTDRSIAKDGWETVASEQRARVRKILRSLENEGISLRASTDGIIAEANGEFGLKASARLAWLMWLSERRSKNQTDSKKEKAVWGIEGSAKMAAVQNAMQKLSLSSIGFLLR